MKVTFVSDFFQGEVRGGAELADSVLIQDLSGLGFEVERVRSSDFDKSDHKLIISNRAGLSSAKRDEIISRGSYIIIEHDSQFLKKRNPALYPDWHAPPHEVNNRELYENADLVVAMSPLHRDLILRHIPSANVVSISCSFWTDDEYRRLEEAYEAKEERWHADGGAFAINWKNPFKGPSAGKEALPVDGDFLGEMDWDDLIEAFVEYETFCFNPHTVESFSRVCAEAKMVGASVRTDPGKIGFFSAYRGVEGLDLIKKLKQAQADAVSMIASTLRDGDNETRPSVTAILNVYRRPHLLQRQVARLKAMEISPDRIWVWVNDHEDNRDYKFHLPPEITIVRSSKNFKYHGRFALAMLADTDLVAFFDDDTMPGREWFSTCMSEEGLSRLRRGDILGGVGVNLHSDNYRDHDRVGWPTRNSEWQQVDLVGHAWILSRETLAHFWEEKMFTPETGEDIHLSFMAAKHQKKTWVPPQDTEEKLSSTEGYELGVDEVASSHPSRHNRFYSLRDQMVKSYRSRGWVK